MSEKKLDGQQNQNESRNPKSPHSHPCPQPSCHWGESDDESCNEYIVQEITVIGDKPSRVCDVVTDIVNERLLIVDKGEKLDKLIESFTRPLNEALLSMVKSDESIKSEDSSKASGEIEKAKIKTSEQKVPIAITKPEQKIGAEQKPLDILTKPVLKPETEKVEPGPKPKVVSKEVAAAGIEQKKNEDKDVPIKPSVFVESPDFLKNIEKAIEKTYSSWIRSGMESQKDSTAAISTLPHLPKHDESKSKPSAMPKAPKLEATEKPKADTIEVSTKPAPKPDAEKLKTDGKPQASQPEIPKADSKSKGTGKKAVEKPKDQLQSVSKTDISKEKTDEKSKGTSSELPTADDKSSSHKPEDIKLEHGQTSKDKTPPISTLPDLPRKDEEPKKEDKTKSTPTKVGEMKLSSEKPKEAVADKESKSLEKPKVESSEAEKKKVEPKGVDVPPPASDLSKKVETLKETVPTSERADKSKDVAKSADIKPQDEKKPKGKALRIPALPFFPKIKDKTKIDDAAQESKSFEMPKEIASKPSDEAEKKKSETKEVLAIPKLSPDLSKIAEKTKDFTAASELPKGEKPPISILPLYPIAQATEESKADDKKEDRSRKLEDKAKAPPTKSAPKTETKESESKYVSPMSDLPDLSKIAEKTKTESPKVEVLPISTLPLLPKTDEKSKETKLSTESPTKESESTEKSNVDDDKSQTVDESKSKGDAEPKAKQEPTKLKTEKPNTATPGKSTESSDKEKTDEKLEEPLNSVSKSNIKPSIDEKAKDVEPRFEEKDNMPPISALPVLPKKEGKSAKIEDKAKVTATKIADLKPSSEKLKETTAPPIGAKKSESSEGPQHAASKPSDSTAEKTEAGAKSVPSSPSVLPDSSSTSQQAKDAPIEEESKQKVDEKTKVEMPPISTLPLLPKKDDKIETVLPKHDDKKKVESKELHKPESKAGVVPQPKVDEKTEGVARTSEKEADRRKDVAAFELPTGDEKSKETKTSTKIPTEKSETKASAAETETKKGGSKDLPPMSASPDLTKTAKSDSPKVEESKSKPTAKPEADKAKPKELPKPDNAAVATSDKPTESKEIKGQPAEIRAKVDEKAASPKPSVESKDEKMKMEPVKTKTEEKPETVKEKTTDFSTKSATKLEKPKEEKHKTPDEKKPKTDEKSTPKPPTLSLLPKTEDKIKTAVSTKSDEAKSTGDGKPSVTASIAADKSATEKTKDAEKRKDAVTKAETTVESVEKPCTSAADGTECLHTIVSNIMSGVDKLFATYF